MLLMQYSLWKLTNRSSALEALGQTVKNVLPDLQKLPSNGGTVAFFDFSDSLQESDADSLISEVKASSPNIGVLDRNLILELHKVLRKKLAHDRAQAGWDSTMLDEAIRQTLHTIKIVNKTQSIYVNPKLFSDAEGAKGDMVLFIIDLRRALNVVKEFLVRQATALREQHGGIQVHQSIEDLMAKIANCVDRTASVVLEKQLMAIHAEQLAAGNCHGGDHIQEIIDILDAFLKGEVASEDVFSVERAIEINTVDNGR